MSAHADRVVMLLKRRYWAFLKRWRAACVTRRRRRGYVYKVGSYMIRMPRGHMLETNQRRCPLYDKALGEIAGTVSRKYPRAAMVDLGANVGDTAALIRSHASNPLVCVEGCPEFLPYLTANAASIGSDVVIVPRFLVCEGFGEIPRVVSRGGTARLALDDEARFEGATTTLGQVLRDVGGEVCLVKSDLDGSDFRVLRSGLDEIARLRPVIFVEYAIEKEQDAREAEELLSALNRAGYGPSLVYDNTGHFMLAPDIGNADLFKDLNKHLELNRRFSPCNVVYLDLCMFHRRDADLHASARAMELRR